MSFLLDLSTENGPLDKVKVKKVFFYLRSWISIKSEYVFLSIWISMKSECFLKNMDKSKV